jgi:hypothetical protein
MKYLKYMLLVLMLLGINSCSQGNKQVPATATPVALTVPENKKPEPEPEKEDNTAHIDQLNILTYESFPVQSNIVVKGYLAHNCVSISDIIESRQEKELQFELVTTRQPGSNCIKKKHDFEEIIPINTAGLKSGFYTVKVNDVAKSFELIVDNIIR